MKKRARRRLLTQKVINARLDLIKKLKKVDCQFLRNVIAEPHRLAKKVDCGELSCDFTFCPFYSELKHNRKKTYKMTNMKRKEL